MVGRWGCFLGRVHSGRWCGPRSEEGQRSEPTGTASPTTGGVGPGNAGQAYFQYVSVQAAGAPGG